MKYAVEMGSSAMMYIPGFIKTGPAIQKLIRGYKDRDIQTAKRSHKPTIIFPK
jgi:hypothetical protein